MPKVSPLDAPLEPVETWQVRPDDARAVWQEAARIWISDLVAPTVPGRGEPLQLLRLMGETRRDMLAFIGAPHRRCDFGLVLDLAGLDREGVAREALRWYVTGWAALGVKASPLAAWVTPNGRGYYCPPPRRDVTQGAFLREAGPPDPKIVYAWR